MRWLLFDEVDEVPVAWCTDIEGLFADVPSVTQVRLVGCRPEPPLLTALGALGRTSATAQRRLQVQAAVRVIAADGSATPVIEAFVSGTITAGEPSPLGGGLLDVTVTSSPQEPLPAGVPGILQLWHHGRPTEKNLWSSYDRALRHQWCGVALAHRRPGPDRPPGCTYDLDGRFVTDVEGFHCAIGEAIAGPGGYFGWNLDALIDCLRGRYGARSPFRLVWHDSAVARDHLVAGPDRRRRRPAVTLEDLVTLLSEHQVEVELR